MHERHDNKHKQACSTQQGTTLFSLRTMPRCDCCCSVTARRRQLKHARLPTKREFCVCKTCRGCGGQLSASEKMLKVLQFTAPLGKTEIAAQHFRKGASAMAVYAWSYARCVMMGYPFCHQFIHVRTLLTKSRAPQASITNRL